MASKAAQHKSELIERVKALAAARLPAERATALSAFVAQFYANVAIDDLASESPDNLYAAALSLWTFAGQRAAGTAKVRVYNPRLDEQGWHSSHTVVEVVNDDMPFLVDSLTSALNQRDLTVYLVIHPIVRVLRDRTGNRAVAGKGEEIAESHMQIRINEQTAPDRLAEIKYLLEQVLADVRAATSDWRSMRARAEEILAALDTAPAALPADEVAEAKAFLKWLNDDHFTYLGYREYDFLGDDDAATISIPPKTGLGILRDEQYSVFDGLRNFEQLPPDVRQFLRQPRVLMITKANRRSTVHRPVHMDTISVKKFDRAGNAVGEQLFVGLLTSGAYSQNSREIPLLRLKVANCLARAGFAPASHDGKALVHILETYPRDELFQISENELYDTALGILHLQERQRIALFTRRDPFERFVSCLVYLPRDRYNTELRLRIQDILARAYDGTVSAYYTHMSDAALGRLQVIIATKRGAIPDVDPEDIEGRLVEAGRSWADQMQDALVEAKGEEKGFALLRRYAEAFPMAYRERFTAQLSVADIDKVEEALSGAGIAMNLYRPLESAPSELKLKLYSAGAQLPLSDVLPMLEHMGFKVISESPYTVQPRGSERAVWIHDFGMITADGREIELGSVRDIFHEALARVWAGEMEDDGFNRLVLGAGLDWREVTILRAYCKYLRQAAIPFSQAYMEATLAGNTAIAALLVKLFRTLFDPASGANVESRVKAIVTEIEKALDGVSNLDEDRILRRFLNVILATQRTNFFKGAKAGQIKPYLSFKLDSRVVDELPLPRPLFEISVYSPRVEAIHLRGGKVARGGIRWSDRREDFRTEVLGLMKTQVVKNSVIVPTGSKGGFVVKRPPAGGGREALNAEVVECYKTMMRGLLDITDNLVGGKLQPPVEVVRRDADDPYLVVAADKGTATFSDIANSVSVEYGFWLDDAFASGGSAGYDHKGMAITARGAWEAVKRHFREVGTDIQAQDFTTVGVGDMSGDVFGNGMLLSHHIRLVAAFNHLHIFLDPDPDPEASWQERKRLFDLPRSAWSDYDPKLISAGGGICERKAKSIKLSAQVKKRFGIAKDSMTPAELIQLLLRAEVDLLWLGGIGTYVKSSEESHADVGDRANDALRVNASDLRCKVAGEGANLGFTQRARVEYALKAGRINSDAVDNSAGVDTSDHEVNIKILLNEVVAAGDMTRKQRDRLLKEITDDVAALVLRDNYLQTQALTVTQTLSARLLDRHVHFMRTLEKAGRLDRAVEFLPNEEAVAERKSAGLGLTRPELAVLLAYAKIQLEDEMVETDLPDDPQLGDELLDYFPQRLREKYADGIQHHRLRREIVTTVIANELVNRAGITFVHEVREGTGMGSADIARAYLAAREIFSVGQLWQQVEALDNKVPGGLQSALLLECGRVIERGTTWLLRNEPQRLDIAATVKTYGAGVEALVAAKGLIADADRTAIDERIAKYAEQGLPKALAQRMAIMHLLPPSLDIVRIASTTGVPVEQVGRTYFAVGARFGLDWLRQAAAALPSENHWDKQAVVAVTDDFYGHQRDLTTRILTAVAKSNGADPIEAWTTARGPAVHRATSLVADLRQSGTAGLAMLAVANRQLRSLTAG
ncbi:MAG TPA: NAD-glutamate dehydrogenase [Candidatus Angelobacter sp.]|nr:NAD-glutamate dehydrogenase [Candidatus Angelobacter sp.]